ncbi:MAG: hypothetical protein V4455_18410 [Pseudomonadota bacterium]
MVYSKVVPTVIGKLYLGEIKHKDFFYCLFLNLFRFGRDPFFALHSFPRIRSPENQLAARAIVFENLWEFRTGLE